MTNPHEALAREIKARHLADIIAACGGTAAQANLMNDTDWRMAAIAAQTKAPSQKTRALVVEMLESRGARPC